MRKCNKCGIKKSNKYFLNYKKKTCKRCEYRFKLRILRWIATRKRLTPLEKMATRIGYMGAGFLVAAQWTVEPMLYIVGFICVMVQTAARRQWNLVALNINGLVAWIKHLLT